MVMANTESKVVNLHEKISFKELLLNTIKESYYNFRDSRIKNISALSTDRANLYINKTDFTKTQNLKILITSIKHHDKNVIIKGIEYLSKYKTTVTKKAIKTCLCNTDEDVVLTAIDSIKEFKSTDIVGMLKGCLVRKNKKIAIHALWALAEMKTHDSIEAIEEAINSNDSEIANTADWILKGLKSTKRKIKA